MEENIKIFVDAVKARWTNCCDVEENLEDMTNMFRAIFTNYNLSTQLLWACKHKDYGAVAVGLENISTGTTMERVIHCEDRKIMHTDCFRKRLISMVKSMEEVA